MKDRYRSWNTDPKGPVCYGESEKEVREKIREEGVTGKVIVETRDSSIYGWKEV